MADPDRALGLDLLVFAPLPFVGDGRPVHQLGVSVFYADLLPRLAAMGHRVRVVTEAPPATPGARRRGLAIEAQRFDVEWFGFEYRSGRRPADPAFCEATRVQVAGRFAWTRGERRPDLVVVGREIVAPAILPICRAEGLPCAVIAHGVTLAAAEGADYPASARQLLYDGLREADHVIAVAEHLADSLRALGVERVSAIANAPDTERFRPGPRDARLLQAWRIDPDRPVVAQVASLKASKRPFDLVRAARILAGEGIELLHVVVGDGLGRVELEAAVQAAGLEAAFRFPGEVEHVRMPEVMRLADMVVLASEREGLPLVYGEAQASGRVVVASDIPAAREAIVDGETGVLFRVGDAVDLAAKLRALAGDRARRERIGRQARAATEAWNAEAVARAYALVFDRIAREARRIR